MRKALLGLSAAVVLLLAFWLYPILFPSDEERIRRVLNDMAKAAEVHANEAPLARLGKANKLAGFFASDIEINLQGVPADWANILGRDQLREVILAGRAHLRQWRLELLGVSIRVDRNEPMAEAFTTAVAEINGEKNAVVQELRLTLKKTERRWLISRVDTISTLRR